MSEKLKIERLSWQGDGVTTVRNEDVFVPFSLPGEIVEGDIANGICENLRILEPVPERVKAPCRHFKKCGGCILQHADDVFLANWKTKLVQDTLALNHVEATFRPILVSPAHSRRRAVFSARRTKKSAEVGFHKRNSDVLINLLECTLVHPQIIAGFDAFREIAKLGCSRKDEIRIGATVTENGLDVDVVDAKELEPKQTESLAQMAALHGFARISWNGEVLAQLQPPTQKFGPAHIIPPSGSFLQATPQGEQVLVSAALETLDGCKRVLDLFSGSGTFTLPLSQIAEVHAVETLPEMLDALNTGWRQAVGTKDVTTEVRDLFYRPLLLDELKKYDGVVIDPPRAGALEQTKILAQSDIKKISFVSCNPATFARDAKILINGGYALNWVQVVDQFRWSAHVELVAEFELKRV
ncbi:MAG: class I SAM-dependent RNA methyltransferase [Amylibacter sp.]|nr:class I SAM-dependent RNA methyltransferase [Amylibacter sp.]